MSSNNKASICWYCHKTRCPVELMLKARDTRSCPNYEKSSMTLHQIAKMLHVSERTFCMKTTKQKIEFAKRYGFKLTIYKNDKNHSYRIERI